MTHAPPLARIGLAAVPAGRSGDATPLLKCRSGPREGERWPVPPGATEIRLPLPAATPDAVPRVAVYRVHRRRRGRTAAFAVLVYVRNEPFLRGDG